ncbi:MAG: hypothetical protein ACI9TH_002979 [Kiritimatiellia bacterium]|jgi:hypothetical protein
MEVLLPCAGCDRPMDPTLFRAGHQGRCPYCNTSVEVHLYPALVNDATGQQRLGLSLTEEDQASCFFHTDSQAEESCDNCGRFLCGLCATPFRDATWCPQCITQGMSSGKMDVFTHRHTLWDTTAASVCVLPIFFTCGYLTFISAPIALFLSLYWWKRPNGILPRSKIRYILTILFSLVQIIAWIALAVMIGTGIAGEF